MTLDERSGKVKDLFIRTMSYPISKCVLYVQYIFHFKVVKGSSLGLKVCFDNMDTLRSKL